MEAHDRLGSDDVADVEKHVLGRAIAQTIFTDIFTVIYRSINGRRVREDNPYLNARTNMLHAHLNADKCPGGQRPNTNTSIADL